MEVIVASPPNRQTFVIELATDGDVTVDEVQGLLVAGGYHVVEGQSASAALGGQSEGVLLPDVRDPA